MGFIEAVNDTMGNDELKLVHTDKDGNEYYVGDFLTRVKTRELNRSLPSGRVIGGGCYKIKWAKDSTYSYVCFNGNGDAFCEFSGLMDSDIKTQLYLEGMRLDADDDIVNMAKKKQGKETTIRRLN